MLVLLAIFQVASILQHYPYYYTYVNPIADRIFPNAHAVGDGYGEGLELAARYLAQKENAAQHKATSWFAIGPFSYFFPGQTYILLPSETIPEDYVDRLHQSDYLVIYPVLQNRLNLPVKLLPALRAYTPEKEIYIDDVLYIQIYRVDQFPSTFFTEISE